MCWLFRMVDFNVGHLVEMKAAFQSLVSWIGASSRAQANISRAAEVRRIWTRYFIVKQLNLG